MRKCNGNVFCYYELIGLRVHWLDERSLENYFLTFVLTIYLFLVLSVISLHIEIKFSSTLFKYLKPIVFLLALQMIVNI
jgi:hypothetical protein